MGIEHKVAVITGASQGIGVAVTSRAAGRERGKAAAQAGFLVGWSKQRFDVNAIQVSRIPYTERGLEMKPIPLSRTAVPGEQVIHVQASEMRLSFRPGAKPEASPRL
jgi:hypothetical protein